MAISSVASKDGQGTSLALLGGQHVEHVAYRPWRCNPFSRGLAVPQALTGTQQAAHTLHLPKSLWYPHWMTPAEATERVALVDVAFSCPPRQVLWPTSCSCLPLWASSCSWCSQVGMRWTDRPGQGAPLPGPHGERASAVPKLLWGCLVLCWPRVCGNGPWAGRWLLAAVGFELQLALAGGRAKAGSPWQPHGNEGASLRC